MIYTAIVMAIIAWVYLLGMPPKAKKSTILRTPDEAFADLPDFAYEPKYHQHGDYRMAWYEDGPKDGDVVLLLHGEPSWSYLYRFMMPVFAAAGYRVIAPDLIGFGRSDKAASRDSYTHQMHVDSITGLIKALGLKDINLFIQDWGGLIGLRVVGEMPDSFARIVAGNTGLPDSHPLTAPIKYLLYKMKIRSMGTVTKEEFEKKPNFLAWVAYSQTVDELDIGDLVSNGIVRGLSAAEVAAYDAPFPDATYKAGTRAFPWLVPSEMGRNYATWHNVLDKWEKPFLTLFSDRDPITKGGEKMMLRRIPGTKGQPHEIIKDGGHFLQDDKGAEIADKMINFIENT